MTISQKQVCISVSCLLILTAFSVVGLADDLKMLKDASARLIQARQENRASLGDFALHWTRTVQENELYPGRKGAYSGSYAMWRKGDKLAFASVADSFADYENSQTPKLERDLQSLWVAYDGIEWRRCNGLARKFVGEPYQFQPSVVTVNGKAFSESDDWFQALDWSIDWSKGTSMKIRSLLDTYLSEHADKFVIDSWSISDSGLVTAALSFPVEKSKLRFEFDSTRGGEAVRQVYDHPGGTQTLEYQLKEVQPKLWFPVVFINASTDPSKKRSATFRYELDNKTSAFGVNAQIDERVFRILTTDEVKVVDLRRSASLSVESSNKSDVNTALDRPSKVIVTDTWASWTYKRRWWSFLLAGLIFVQVSLLIAYKQQLGRREG